MRILHSLSLLDGLNSCDVGQSMANPRQLTGAKYDAVPPKNPGYLVISRNADTAIWMWLLTKSLWTDNNCAHWADHFSRTSNPSVPGRRRRSNWRSCRESDDIEQSKLIKKSQEYLHRRSDRRSHLSGMRYTVQIRPGTNIQVTSNQTEMRVGDCVTVEQRGSTSNLQRISSYLCAS